MSDKPFALVFAGQLAEGQVRAAVQARLAKIYGKPVGDLDRLFTGGSHVIKRTESAEKLQTLYRLFTDAGAIVSITNDGAPSPGNAAAARAAAVGTAAGSATDRPVERAPTADTSRTRNTTGRFTLEEFVSASQQRDHGDGVFELEDQRLMEVNLDGRIWIKMGAMVAYRGDVKFTREGLLDKGVGRLLKRSFTGEGAALTKAEGRGRMYLADSGKKITILELRDDAIIVNGNDVLALEWQVDWDVRMMRRISTMLAGGLFNMRLAGTGLLAITTHYDPLTLQVTPGNPVFTDPNATVAWSATLDPEVRTDISFKTFLGRGSGESIQLKFDGMGFVVVQPFEEVYLQRG